MSRKTIKIVLDESENEFLRKILNKRSVPEFIQHRFQVVLSAATGSQNKNIAAQNEFEVHFIAMAKPIRQTVQKL